MAAKNTIRQLVLNKGIEKYIFRYDRGCEDKLLDALIAQAKDERNDFDWFDAAVLSFKLAFRPAATQVCLPTLPWCRSSLPVRSEPGCGDWRGLAPAAAFIVGIAVFREPTNLLEISGTVLLVASAILAALLG